MTKYLSVLDRVIRGIALISLIPFAIASLVMGVLTTDAPGSSILPMFAVWSVAFIIGTLVFLSSYAPDSLSKYGLLSRILMRFPAYLFAPFGMYYGFPMLYDFIF